MTYRPVRSIREDFSLSPFPTIRVVAYLMRYRVVFITAGVGRIINGGERGEGRRTDATDGFLADLRTSAADILVQRSRTL